VWLSKREAMANRELGLFLWELMCGDANFERVFSWKSKKQSLTTTSIAESELVALSDTSSLLFYMEKFLIGQGWKIAKKIVYQDNATTIHMLTAEKYSTARNAHIGAKYFFLRDHIARGSKSSTSDLNS
jgi:hypothetical protein